MTLDVAHPARPPEAVEQELLDGWSSVRNSPTLRILKIIHGHGSSGRGGTTRDLVRNWAFRHRDRFRAVIAGEEFDLFDARTQAMREEIGSFPETDLGAANRGVTLIWVK